MSIFLKKAQENLTSAEILMTNAYFNSSVHCSYYSAFQLVLHFADINNSSIFKISAERENSHIERINKTRNFISSISIEHKRKARDFDIQIKLLKSIRKDADYTKIEVTEDLSKECMKYAKNLNKLLLELCNEK